MDADSGNSLCAFAKRPACEDLVEELFHELPKLFEHDEEDDCGIVVGVEEIAGMVQLLRAVIR